MLSIFYQGEFNSGKSTVINALLGRRYLKDGVVPTTNEITFLRFSELSSNEQQRCERHPDGQYICYLPAPILKEVSLYITPSWLGKGSPPLFCCLYIISFCDEWSFSRTKEGEKRNVSFTCSLSAKPNLQVLQKITVVSNRV